MRKVMAVVFALVIMTCSSFSMAEGDRHINTER